MRTQLRRGVLRFGLLGLLVGSVTLTLVGSSAAASFQVTNLNNAGPGSLRQAVLDANAAAGSDTISFAAGLTGTITLTSGPLSVSGGPLIIVGPGAANLTVSGNGTSGILFAQSTDLSVSGLTLADGAAPNSGGGAILNFGATVAVSETVFLRNSAFAGGAIENTGGGTLTITSSTFSGNSAFPGGAISNDRSFLTITNSTFVGNSAVVGGAVYNLNVGTVRVTSSTFSNNTATQSGSALNSEQALAITVENSLFAGNGCAGPITDGGGNLDWPDSGCPGMSGDPQLQALGDNGGPTPTVALGPGSAAIDAASSLTCPATDQRGIARPQGTGCDVGAFELAAPSVVYEIQGFFSPVPKATPKVGSTLPVKVALALNGRRISDADAAGLLSPCRVFFKTEGASPSDGPVCMTYDATKHQFQYDWKIAKTTAPTAPATISIEVTVKNADGSTNNTLSVPVTLTK